MTGIDRESAETPAPLTGNPYAPPSSTTVEDAPMASRIDASRSWAVMPAALGLLAAGTGVMMIIASTIGLVQLGLAGRAFFSLLIASAVPFAAASRSYWNGNRRRGIVTMALVPLAIIPALAAVIYLEG